MALRCSTVVAGLLRRSPWLVQSRSLQVTASLAYRRPKIAFKDEKYPGSYEYTELPGYTNGLRRVQPPDWDGMAYQDRGGWFMEWLAGRNPEIGSPADADYCPASRKEYHEYEALWQEARDHYFATYPPTPLPEDWYDRVFDFCIKYDNEPWIDMLTMEYWEKFASSYNYEPTLAKIKEFKSIKRQEKWDSY